MSKYLLCILVILTTDVYGQLSFTDKNRVDGLFKSLTSHSSPGAALGIIKEGKLIYTKGYGLADVEHQVPLTDSSIFYIGSVSKQFVAMCVLLLEEQGKIGLDDRVQKYLPDFPEYDAPLTIRNFIHHTSGVRDNLTLLDLTGSDYLNYIDKEEMYQLIRRQKTLNFTPGEKHLYSNACYFMLGLIIEKISGVSLREFAQKNIFEPLGMRNTFFLDDNTEIIKNRAFCYLSKDGRLKNQLVRYDLVGSGGIYSNIQDLFLWDQNFYHNKLGKGSQKLVDNMHTDGKLTNGQRVEYAFAVRNGTYRGLRTVGHTGALAGYRSYLLRFPQQQLSVIILGNIVPIPILKLANGVADILLEKQLAPLAAVPVTSSTDIKSKADHTSFALVNAEHYVGEYYSEELEVTYRITTKDNQLYCSIKNKQPVSMLPKRQDVFTTMITDYEIELTFERAGQTQISGFIINAGWVTNLKFKRGKGISDAGSGQR